MGVIPYGRQFIDQDDINAVTEALQSDFLTQGPRIAAFEEAFANYVNAKYAIAVSNGTAALHLSCLALGLGEGDRIITTPITFAASGNCALYCGAEVHFADIDPDTYVIDVASVKSLIESKPKGYFKGIIPVDFTGYPVNLQELRSIAEAHDLWVIEDACHAPGGYFKDDKGNVNSCGNGKFADLAVFSFHPVKHIACGEGGMITTNDEALYKKLQVLRTHGITKNDLHKDFPEAELQGAWYYEMQDLGYNYRITDIQAALGITQLNKADVGIAKRQEIAKKYRTRFANNAKIKMQADNEGSFNAHHLFVIEVENRLDLYNHLRDSSIFAQIHYIPMHLMPYYKNFGWKEGDFPNAERYYKRCLSLPMYPTLSDEEQNFVIEKVLEFVNG